MRERDISRPGTSKVIYRKSFMLKVLDSWVDIDASLAEVWDALIDFKSWEKWNSFIPQVKGNSQVGEKLKIEVFSPGMKKMVFEPEVYDIDFQKKISWGGSFLILYNGVHDFILEEVSHNKVRFRQIENFRGPIVLLMGKMIKKTAIGYQNMNEEFKRYIENAIGNSDREKSRE